MDYIDIFAKFLELYPDYRDKVCAFAPSGKYSIEVGLQDESVLKFLYFDDGHHILLENDCEPENKTTKTEQKPIVTQTKKKRNVKLTAIVSIVVLVACIIFTMVGLADKNDPDSESTTEVTDTMAACETSEAITEAITESTKTTEHITESTETCSTEPSEPVETEPQPEVDPDDVELLAMVIFQEAGGDAYCDECRRRVADVVLNRVASGSFPDTIHGVLSQRSQYGRFYWTGVVWSDRASDPNEEHAVERARRIAREVLEGNHSELYGNGYIWQAEFVQGTDGFWHCGNYFGR